MSRKKYLRFQIYLLVILSNKCDSILDDLNISPEHLPYFFNLLPEVKQKCIQDTDCKYKKYLNTSGCWSYENNCHFTSSRSYSQPLCEGDSKGWVSSKKEQLELFYNQADFGFVKEQRGQLQYICRPDQKSGLSSNLECTDHLKFCRGTNIRLDLTSLASRSTPVRYHMDVLSPGDVHGHCRLDRVLQQRHSDMISPLQSWGPELRHFTATPTPPHQWQCDVWYHRPVIVVKIDAAVSLYHHFCDFVNLYISQHVNATDEFAFSTDVDVLVWESYPYISSFASVWRAFTRRPVRTLADVAGKRLCFKHVMFPLLPRMIFGLYYNTPLVWGCEKSGLFRAFNRHVLHRLHVPTPAPLPDRRVRVTLLARQTQHRRVLNQDDIVRAMQLRPDIVLSVAEFNHGQDFELQLRAITATDVLVGMHGAGLTHLLFLPDWAAVFEIYNCGDEHCYKDLARLRGVFYYTWQHPHKMASEDEGTHPEHGAHEKFQNYRFDPVEFMRLLDEAVEAVRRHPAWLSSDNHQQKRHEPQLPAKQEL
ncbi:Glycosyltransferase 61 [Trinorchestia longiramus]|nr:Glycosyltransferase 61 [Trinorchestia longiramus]